MPGDEIAHVLGAEPPLHRTLAKIADLAGRGYHYADEREPPGRGVLQKEGEGKADDRRRQCPDNKSAPGLLR